MRIISGSCRGRRLSAPPGIITRPTSDRVKEALFNTLSSRFDFTDARVLDICAGTGSLGLEALSRGAKSCCFIEWNASIMTILDKNLIDTHCKDKSEILMMDAVKALKAIAGRGQQYDLVLFDPPYDSDLYKRIFEAPEFPDVLSPGAIVVAECAKKRPLLESYGRLKRFDRRIYGESALELFI